MHEHPCIQEKCRNLLELLHWCLGLDDDSSFAMLLVCYTSRDMTCFEFSTCFHVSFLLVSNMVHKVFGVHCLALGTFVLLGSVGGDKKKF